jgi:hypothetical protein
MTTTPSAASSPTLTHARARLYLGSSAVGTITVLALAALVLGLPHRFLPTAAGHLLGDALWVALAVALHAAVLAPFDLFAGRLIPAAYGRSSETLLDFARRWWRGAFLHGLALVVAATLLMLGGRVAGAWGAWWAFVGLSALLLAAQPWIAAAVGGGRVRRPGAGSGAPLAPLGRGVLLLDGPHRHVTGGAYGLPFAGRWVVPSRWLDDPDRVALAAQVARRAWLSASGARDRGVIAAVAWNAWPVAAALLAWGAPASPADVVRLALVSTLASFVGVLVLPTASRRAVLAADRAAVAVGVDARALAEGLAALDRDQDDEPDRPEAVETIFHPIPALARRRAALATALPGATPSGGVAWHAARTALFTSWAGVGLLGRAVHCNLGRSEAWVFLPSD